ncbi:MAG: nuclear transport factor 2 family protein [Chitinophagaceae bacterium]|nr:nuclear transport factor 2 family protein [Chitinophagaceae bacterium]
MKKSLFILTAGTIIFFTSCSSKKEEKSNGISDKAKANIAASHVVSDAFMTGDLSKIDSVVSSDFVDHTDKGDMGRDSLKAMITLMHAKIKDQKMETIKDLADDEYVFSWIRYTGTSDGSLGMPAGPYDMTAMEVVKFKEGKAIEHWAFMEPREMVKMMAPPPSSGEKTP